MFETRPVGLDILWVLRSAWVGNMPLWQRGRERAPRRLDVVFFAQVALRLIAPSLFCVWHFEAVIHPEKKKEKSPLPMLPRPCAEPNFTVLSGDFVETNSQQSRAYKIR